MSIAAASSKFFSKAVVFAVRNSRLAHRLSRLSPQLRFRPSAMVARQSMVVTDTMGAMMKKLEVPADSACKLTDDQTKFVKEAFMLMDSEGNGEAKFKDMANFMKSMGREATDVQLTDMLTSINAQAGAHGKPKESADEGISFQAFYTLMAPIVGSKARRLPRFTSASVPPWLTMEIVPFKAVADVTSSALSPVWV